MSSSSGTIPAEQLFQGDDPLNKEVEIGGDEFRVIGVMDARKTPFRLRQES